jgi:hypothetical protein
MRQASCPAAETEVVSKQQALCLDVVDLPQQFSELNKLVRVNVLSALTSTTVEDSFERKERLIAARTRQSPLLERIEPAPHVTTGHEGSIDVGQRKRGVHR